MPDLREATDRLLKRAAENDIQFPSKWKDTTKKRACSATLMLQNKPGGGFDEDAALRYLKEKYDTKKTSHAENDTVTSAEKKRDSVGRTRKSKRPRSPIHGGGNKDTSPSFSPKKFELVVVEENRPIVEMLREVGALHYKMNEPKKGTAYMNAVKHLRHCTHAIKDKADAQKIQGIGERIADHIEEFLKTGDVKLFEEMRKKVV